MQSSIVITQRVLNLAGAERALDTGIGLAKERGLLLSFAVVDPSGHLLTFRRMDGANLVTVEAAQGKARTSAYLKGPSGRFSELIEAGRTSMLTMPGLVSVRGGVPVMIDGEVVAAVGVSGTRSEVDEEIAQLMAEELTSK